MINQSNRTGCKDERNGDKICGTKGDNFEYSESVGATVTANFPWII